MGLLGDLIKTVSDVMTSGRRQNGTPSREAGLERRAAAGINADGQFLIFFAGGCDAR